MLSENNSKTNSSYDYSEGGIVRRMSSMLYGVMRFADKLKQLMEDTRFSQSELGKRVDVSQSLVSHWLKGINKPSFDIALKLSKELDVSLDYLFNEDVRLLSAEELRCEREIRRIVGEIGPAKAWRRLIGVGEYPDQRPERSGAGGMLPEMKSSKKDVG